MLNLCQIDLIHRKGLHLMIALAIVMYITLTKELNMWDNEKMYDRQKSFMEDYAKPECTLSKEAEDRSYYGGEFFEELCDIMYGEESIDEDRLEDILEEIGSYLGRKIPSKRRLTVERRKASHLDLVDDELERWKHRNNNYLRSL